MAYRDDLDAFLRRRVRDDDEAALLASFHDGERVRRKRTLVTWLGGIAVALCALCVWPAAEARSVHRGAPAAGTPPLRLSDAAKEQRHACLRRVVRDYLGYTALPQASAYHPDFTLEDLGRECLPSPDRSTKTQ